MALTTDSRRERLRRQWLEQAEAAFELMFDAGQQDRLVTFDQREHRACSLTRELAAWLLEQHIAEDPAVRRTDTEAPACPRCSRPARRQTPPEDPLPGRALTSAAGEVTLRRERWYCPTCRAAFFPLDHKLGLGTEGYSPGLLRKAVRQSACAASFREASDDLRAWPSCRSARRTCGGSPSGSAPSGGMPATPRSGSIVRIDCRGITPGGRRWPP